LNRRDNFTPWLTRPGIGDVAPRLDLRRETPGL